MLLPFTHASEELTESLFLPGAILEAFYYGTSNSNIADFIFILPNEQK